MKYLKYSAFMLAILFSTTPSFAGPYDGTYLFSVINSIGPCGIQPGNVTIKDGKISGTLIGSGQQFKITGKVKDNGKVRGKIIGNIGRGSFRGDLADGTNKGKWTAGSRCRGEYVISQ